MRYHQTRTNIILAIKVFSWVLKIFSIYRIFVRHKMKCSESTGVAIFIKALIAKHLKILFKF